MRKNNNILLILRFFLTCLLVSTCLLSFGQRPTFGGSGSNPFGNQTTTTTPGGRPTQNKSNKSRAVKRDTLNSVIPDSLRSKENGLQTTVNYSAEDSTVLDVDGKVVHLYGKAVVEYGDINLAADYIRLDWNKSEVFAHGSADTSKANGVKGKPVFMQGTDKFNTDTIRYNFKSKKAIIKNIVTQQGDGFVQGARVKKEADDDLYLVSAKYTTCNLKDPHFYINARKIKLVNRKEIISGTFNLVINDIPLPIGLPFGFFPVPKKKELGTAGIIMGSYGEEPNGRGFYFRDFGYYFPINEYIGGRILGQIYSKGSWGVGVQTSYSKRYRYSGSLNFQYNYNQSGLEFPELVAGTPAASRDFSLTWSHAPQSRRADRSFSASVNLVSNGYNRNNTLLNQAYGSTGYLNNAFGSSIQYSRTFAKNIRFGTSLRVDQNVSTKILNLGVDYNFGINQFNPFVPEKRKIGRWYEAFRVGLDITGGVTATNDITYQTRSTTYYDYSIIGVTQQQLTDQELKDQALGITTSVTKTRSITSAADLVNLITSGQFRTSYSIPITLPNFKIARFINFTPSISLQGDIYTKKLHYQYFDSYDPAKDANLALHHRTYGAGTSGVLIDTTNGFYNTYRYSVAASFNTRVYGTYNFGKNGRLQAIRHTLIPSISVGYTPDFSGQFLYNTRIRKDSTTKSGYAYRDLPVYIGTTSSATQSGSVSFSLTNTLEAKIRAKSDTAAKEFEKISLLDNLSLTGSYNLLAPDSLYPLSNIGVSASTTILKGLINLNSSATFDPYAYRDKSLLYPAGIRTYHYAINSGQGLAHLTNLNISLGTRLTPQGFKAKTGPQMPVVNPNAPLDPAREAQLKFIKQNPDLYVDFNIPWTLSVSYNLGYSKNGLAPSQVVQALTFQGDLSLTPKWKVGFNTGYDFQFKTATLTTINIHRDLHCWDMAFSWTPIAGSSYRASSFSFDLKPKAGILQELKLSRRRISSYNGGF